MTHARAALVAFAALQLAIGAVHAEYVPRDIAAANTLFAEGRQLSASGRHAEACARFEASMTRAPRLGVQLNLADCYERLGKTASAWVVFEEAAALAQRVGDKREAWARQRRDALAGRLSRLVISLSSSAPIGDLVVVRDGARVEPTMYGVGVPVDPGEHLVEATAPGRIPWSTRVVVSGEGEVVAVEVPELAPRLPAPAGVRAEPTTEPRRRHPTAATWIAGGVGVAGIAAGAILGLSARSQWRHARPGCDTSHACDDAAAALVERSRRDGNLSTVAFAIGGAALATGLVLYLRSPRDRRAVQVMPAVANGAAGAVLSGAF